MRAIGLLQITPEQLDRLDGIAFERFLDDVERRFAGLAETSQMPIRELVHELRAMGVTWETHITRILELLEQERISAAEVIEHFAAWAGENPDEHALHVELALTYNKWPTEDRSA